jgi:hypothetical protein
MACLSEIERRIARSQRLKLMELSYRGERLDEIGRMLFGHKLHKVRRKRTDPHT